MTFVRLLCSSVAVLVAIGSSLPSAWASETNDESRLRRVGASYRFDVNLEGGWRATRPSRATIGF